MVEGDQPPGSPTRPKKEREVDGLPHAPTGLLCVSEHAVHSSPALTRAAGTGLCRRGRGQGLRLDRVLSDAQPEPPPPPHLSFCGFFSTPTPTHPPTHPHHRTDNTNMAVPAQGLEQMMGLKPGEVATGVSLWSLSCLLSRPTHPPNPPTTHPFPPDDHHGGGVRRGRGAGRRLPHQHGHLCGQPCERQADGVAPPYLLLPLGVCC